MALPALSYVYALRWETRCVISFLVVTCVAITSMVYADDTAALVILSAVSLIGVGLAISLRQLLRRDYLHTSPVGTVVALVPPITLATVYVGLLTSWMQRVGFGLVMRIAVTSLLLWAVVTVGARLTVIESIAVLIASLATAVMRQRSTPSRYLLPWVALVIGLVISRAVEL